ncbi:MAG: ATP-binding protein [Cyanobacteriota bacterium]|nr:ATP-binding protein [Cyanobacteriota bacterium]
MNDASPRDREILPARKPARHRFLRLRWFDNLPIRRKQLLGLLTSEVLSVVGLMGVGACLIVLGGHRMLLHQAQSELAVTQINYDIKIDQMGFGFRGQSDNVAIVDAARTRNDDRPLEPALHDRVKEILQNEIKARNIEYATLVGNDLRVIVNANTDRTDEIFNPNNLVRQAIEKKQQIKTSELVRTTELRTEGAPLPPNFAAPDALIRYTVTPVRDSQKVIGALVSGDIVNQKRPIVERTIGALGGGYSAIYLHQPTGEFVLATSDTEPQIAALGEVLQGGKQALLSDAVATPGESVTQRIRAGNRTHTVAAKSVTNFAGEPVAVLVRGTPETALNALLGQSLRVQIILAVFALAVDVPIAIWLGNAIVGPIKRLRQTTRSFADGDLQARTEVTTSDEVGELATTFNQMADRIVSAWQVEAAIQEQVRLNKRLQQEIAERVQAEMALKKSKTLLKQRNEELQQLLLKLQSTTTQMIQAEKMSSLGQTVAGVAHEINNPVNFIHGNLTYARDYARDLLETIALYQKEYPDPPPAIAEKIQQCDLDFIQEDLLQLLGSMKVGTDRIREIVKSLRTFSRLDEADMKAIDICEGIESTLMILKSRLKAKPDRQAIEIAREYGSLPWVECYPGQLNQVFMNLLANAIDALEETMEKQPLPNPKIWIRTRLLAQNWVRISIADNGSGIPKAAIAKLFDPFFTTKDVGKGTGLGLSISYQIIVDRHRGRLRCESAPERGTEFIIDIPLRQQKYTPIDVNDSSSEMAIGA